MMLVQPGGEVALGVPDSSLLPMKRLQKRQPGAVLRFRGGE